jgi:SAM-dependent methyltransferase
MSFMPAGLSEGPGRDLAKAALCGEPSYVWREGQERRLKLILAAAGEQASGTVLENGCGVGTYVDRLASQAEKIFGLEYDLSRAMEARQKNLPHKNASILCAAGEALPFPDQSISFILSHEVLEHVEDDLQAVEEMARTLKPLGRMVVFVPNRGYPFETHGIYWKGEYRFGNIPLVNYLPRRLRNRFAPHVRVYTSRDLQSLFNGLSVRVVQKRILFGAYDNVIARWPQAGRILRSFLQFLEQTPLKFFGLSHFWVIEKLALPEAENQAAGSRKS